MPILVKKIISYIDNRDSYCYFDLELPGILEFEGINSNIVNSVPGPMLGEVKMGSLINRRQFNQLITTGPYGIFYLNLRNNTSLIGIEVEPREVIIDITPVDDSSERLFYTFYNGSSSESAIIIKANVVEDSGEFCQKLRTQKDDRIWREYLVKQSMKKTSTPSKNNRGKAPDVMTADEVAKYLGLETKTIRNWTSAKKIPSIKMGGTVRYKKTDIDEYMDKSRVISSKVKKKNK